MVAGFLFGVMKKFWNYIVVMVAHVVTIMPSDCNLLVVQMVNFMSRA